MSRCAVLSLVLCGCLGGTSASATTVPPMTMAELRAAADVVVEGTVAATETRWVGQRIITFVTIVSGAGTRLTATLVAVPGGVVDGIAQVVPGSPVLETGVRYRLYLGDASGPKLDGRGVRARGVMGFFRGAFVVTDAGAVIPLAEDGRMPRLVTP